MKNKCLKFAICMACLTACTVLWSAELVAHWNMNEEVDETSLSPTVGSISITLKNGAVAGTAAVDETGVTMTGGAGQLVNSSTLIPATDDFGFFLWISFTNLTQQTSQMHLFSCNAGQENRANFIIVDSGDKLGWFHSGGAGRTGTAVLNDGAWHHVGFTRRGGRSQLWVDGVPDGAPSSVNTAPISQAQDWRIGSFVSETSGLYHGRIDDLRVYHGTLTDEDVAALVAASVPPLAVHRWRLDEAAGIRPFAPDEGWMTTSSLTAPESGVRAVDATGINLDGASSLRIPCSKFLIPATNDFSVFLWARDDAAAPTTAMLFSNNALGSSQPNRCSFGVSYDAGSSPGKLFFFHPSGAFTGSTSIRDLGWHHLGLIRRGNRMELWLDGDLNASRDYAVDFTLSQAQDWRIGAAASERSDFFTGRIDDLRVYTNALDTTEVAGLYDSYTATNSLIAHWRFEDAANVRRLQPEVGWREIDASGLLQVGGQGADGNGLWANATSRGQILGSKKMVPATNDFTVLLWMRTTPSSTLEKHLFTNNGSQNGRCNLTYDASNANKLTWWVNPTYGLISVNAGSGAAVDDGVWHQVGISRHGKTFRLWRDGINVSSATSSAEQPQIVQTFDWFIASSAHTVGGAFYGNTGASGYALLDDLRVYNYGLDATAVSSLYNAFTPLPTAAPNTPQTDHSAIESETGGVVVGHLAQISAESGFHLPSLLVRGSDYLVAATVLNSSLGVHTKIYRSTNQGAKWSTVSEVTPLYGGTLFENGGALYLIGNSNDGGTVVIRRSDNSGATWTSPVSGTSGILTTNTGWNFRAGAMTVHNGRVWVYVERRGNTARGGYAANVEAGALSAPVGADLLDAANWTVSDPLIPIPENWDTAANFRGWTDGRTVADKAERLRMLMRVTSFNDHAEYLALLTTGEAPEDALTLTPSDDMVLLPGGDSAFSVRYDDETRRFWALTNPEGTDRVGLFSSFTLRDWAFHAMPLEAQAGRTQTFMWPDSQIDGDDLVSVYRTCYADQDGEPASAADLNYILFKRIPNFRQIPTDKEEGRLLVADTGNNCVRRYSYGSQNGWLFDDGEKNLFASGTYAGQELTAPYGLATSGNTVYISEKIAGGRVLAFSRRGRFHRVVHTFGGGSIPGALAVSDGALYASDEATDQVWRIDPTTSAATIWLEASGAGYALQELCGLACDSSGNLYLADRAGNAILQFNAAGELDGSVTLTAPEALLWDAPAGRLLASAYLTPDIVSINPASWAITAVLDNDIGNQRFRGLAIVNGRLFFTSDALNRINRQEGPSAYTAADIRLNAPGQLLLLPEGAAVYPDAALGTSLILK